MRTWKTWLHSGHCAPMLNEQQILAVRTVLPRWFKANARDLPWRKTYHPYHVWISEIMLQQTQMERGTVYFKRWMDRFPDIRAVALADEQEILSLWEGLGYYSRARNIHKAARIIMEKHAGTFPSGHDDILALPGIGPYTVGAISSIAFEQDVVAVDANVERILARLTDLDAPVTAPGVRGRLKTMAESLLPPGRARIFNQALMEFGALVCTPKNPDCQACVLAEVCLADTNGTVALRPVPSPKKKITPLTMAAVILIRDGKIAVRQRPATGLWPNMWEFPGVPVEAGNTPEQEIIKEIQRQTGAVPALPPELLAVVKHVYTRYRVTLHGYICEVPSSCRSISITGRQWAALPELNNFAFSSGQRKLIDLFRRDLRYRAMFAG